MSILIIGGADYSSNVIVGSYSVNAADMYSDWIDANGVTHRQIIRSKISGKMSIQFKSMSAFNDFVTTIEENKTSGGWVPCYLFVNNLNKNKSCNCFISYNPALTKKSNFSNMVDVFDLEVVER